MPVSLTQVRDILLPGLRMTPEERKSARQLADRDMQEKIAAERAHYHSLSESERREYDALTEGMMPRLRKKVG